jgi:hypothetical protein
MRPIGCPETSVRNYHYSRRNNPEERSFHVNLIFPILIKIPNIKLKENLSPESHVVPDRQTDEL